METSMSDMELDRIRARLAAEGNHSHTTLKFQDDLLFFANKFAAHGNCVIEVGCWRGGMSAQLAYLARKLGQRFEIIDIDANNLEYARAAVEMAGSSDSVGFHHSDFQSFVATADPKIRPTLVFIDADHRYDAVVADIRTLYSMSSRPYSAAFHDFSLRYSTPELADVRVDLALLHAFGQDFQHIKIGTIAVPGGALRIAPEADGYYHELGYSEGVLIECQTMVGQRDEQIANITQAITRRDQEIVSLGQAVSERDERIADLTRVVTCRDQEVVSLSQAVSERDEQIANLTRAVTRRDQEIVSFSQAVSERDEQIANLARAVTRRDQEVVSLSEAVSKCDGEIAVLHQLGARCDEQIADLTRAVTGRNEEAVSLSQAVSERDAHIANLDQAGAERDAEIAVQDAEIAVLNQAVAEAKKQNGALLDGIAQTVIDRDRELQALQLELTKVLQSTCWRATAPFRATVTLGRRVLYFGKKAAKNFWARRELILKSATRQIRASSLFDASYYLAANPDVRDARIDPATHYLIHGWKEYRNPSAAFDTAGYLSNNPDVAEAGLNPLIHYLKYGQKEGRSLGSDANSSENLTDSGSGSAVPDALVTDESEKATLSHAPEVHP
jgi:Methyltransferase domain